MSKLSLIKPFWAYKEIKTIKFHATRAKTFARVTLISYLCIGFKRY